MKPGDMIEWIYTPINKSVKCEEHLFSSMMSRWVPIYKASLLISITDETYTWLNDKGYFTARMDDVLGASVPAPGYQVKVVPRKVDQ